MKLGDTVYVKDLRTLKIYECEVIILKPKYNKIQVLVKHTSKAVQLDANEGYGVFWALTKEELL